MAVQCELRHRCRAQFVTPGAVSPAALVCACRYTTGTSLSVRDTVIQHGGARFRGGGVFVHRGSATFDAVAFHSVWTTFNQFVPFFTSGGGALYVGTHTHARLVCGHCSLIARGHPRARMTRYAQLTTVTVSNSTMAWTRAGLLGGAMAFAEKTQAVVRNVASSNSTAVGGGTLSLVGGAVADVEGLHVYVSIAHVGGGALVQESQLTMRNSTFSACHARGSVNLVGMSDAAQFLGGKSLHAAPQRRHHDALTHCACRAGGAIMAQGGVGLATKLDISHTEFRRCSGYMQGGAVCAILAEATLTDVVCSDNHMLRNDTADPASGGCIYAGASAVTLARVAVVNNSAEVGGGIALVGRPRRLAAASFELPPSSLRDVALVGNSASLSCGGMLLAQTPAAAENLWVVGNHVVPPAVGVQQVTQDVVGPGDGGGMCVVDGSQLSLTGVTTVSRNSARRHGGAIACSKSVLTTTLAAPNATMSNGYPPALFMDRNTASEHGGALLLTSNSRAAIANALVRHNHAGTRAGGIDVDSESLADVTDARFVYNTVGTNTSREGNGGALGVGRGSAVNVSAATMGHNTAPGRGGALYVASLSKVWLDQVHVYNNTAGADGGGVAVTGATLRATNVTYTHNAAEAGGAVHASGDRASVSLNGGSLAGNSALDGYGGGVFRTAGVAFSSTEATSFSGNAGGNDVTFSQCRLLL